MEMKTERSNCNFAVQQASNGTPVLVVKLYQDSIPLLTGTSIGFDLLGGISAQQAKKLADMLNEHVLDLFVTSSDNSKEAG
jgi:hypothetical protein